MLIFLRDAVRRVILNLRWNAIESEVEVIKNHINVEKKLLSQCKSRSRDGEVVLNFRNGDGAHDFS